MALTPNEFVSTSFDIPIETDELTEGMGNMAIDAGYYKPGPSGGEGKEEESVLLEVKRTITNYRSTVIRVDREEWFYDVYKGPPTEFKREVRSACYLPGMGRSLRKVEEEQVVFWTFTPLTSADNLGRTRFVSAFVVYDLPVDPTKTTDGETTQKLDDAQIKPSGTDDRIISSGKLWSEAVSGSGIVEDESSNQIVKWVNNVIVEHDLVEEEPDKWIIWTIKKNALRPQDVQVDGPKFIKKTGFRYQFPVPMQAPEIKKASSTANGVRLTIVGGGVEFENKWLREKIKIPPDKYNIYRALIAEPPRDESGDKEDWWDPDPSPEGRPHVIGTTATTDQGGTPSDPLPGPSSIPSEPGDPEPPEEPTEVSFTMIGTVDNDNARRWRDEGHAEFVDGDVQNNGEYEYYAESIIGDNTSPESNHVTIIYTGGDHRTHRLGFRTNDNGDIEIDADAPNDPGVPPDDYGEVIEVEIPTSEEDDDLEDLAGEVAPRQFAATEPDISISIDVLIPLLGLEYGQAVILPEVLWETYGNQLIMSQQTLPENWMLSGFNMRFERDNAGGWNSQNTTLSLRKRSTT